MNYTVTGSFSSPHRRGRLKKGLTDLDFLLTFRADQLYAKSTAP